MALRISNTKAAPSTRAAASLPASSGARWLVSAQLTSNSRARAAR